MLVVVVALPPSVFFTCMSFVFLACFLSLLQFCNNIAAVA
jgi:hypothetical protein